MYQLAKLIFTSWLPMLIEYNLLKFLFPYISTFVFKAAAIIILLHSRPQTVSDVKIEQIVLFSIMDNT